VIDEFNRYLLFSSVMDQALKSASAISVASFNCTVYKMCNWASPSALSVPVALTDFAVTFFSLRERLA